MLSSEAYWADLEAKCLVREAVVLGEEVRQRKLGELIRVQVKGRLGLALLRLEKRGKDFVFISDPYLLRNYDRL